MVASAFEDTDAVAEELARVHEVVDACGSDIVRVGTVTDLEATFCRRTVTLEDILGIYDAVADGWGEDPACDQWGISCYIGGRITVEDGIYGTLCFVDDSPRSHRFSPEEKTFVDLMTRWFSLMAERCELRAGEPFGPEK